jgi:pimeloyl-ACP methyl ester carboxylesterase
MAKRYGVNGIELDVVEAGDPGGPAVVLAHGFPESSHSWRHQIGPLADAGYHVLVPDQRGYGRSSAPPDVAAYGVEHLAGDLLGLLDATGHDDAVFVGHDWGALLVWDLARIHPGRVRAVVNVSVPYTEWPAPPTEVFKALSGDRFFYILYFQEIGPAERELGADVERTMRTVLWAASGDGFVEQPPPPPPAEGTGWLDVMAALEIPDGLPRWLTDADLAAYVDAFTASGFFGPVSWYRNLDHNHALVKDRPAPAMPVWFVGGTRDPVIAHRPGYVEAMATRLPDLRGTTLIDGAGHWTQQEAPEAFNRALLGALAELDAPSR